MFDTIFGLPVHALVVHAVVILMPLAAVTVLGAVAVPRFRLWAGPLPLLLSVVATALVPVATLSGAELERRRNAFQSPAVQTHSALGDLMIWWGIGLVLMAAALYWWHRQTKASGTRASSARSSTTTREPAKPLGIAIMVVTAAVAVGALVHIVRIGDSGARAVWGTTVQTTN
jgi:hypothetical protein